MKGFLSFIFAFVLIITGFLFFKITEVYATVITQNVLTGAYTSIQNCVFGASSDSTCTLTFHLNQSITNIPDVVSLTPMANSSGSVKNGAIFSPFISSISPGIVTIKKPAIAGSGGNIVRVTIRQLHSIIK